MENDKLDVKNIHNPYTIGIAGHIDHGKTTLTKALTGVYTDRLKDEIERQISIEPGYAPIMLGNVQASIVDVPGHERFIRQMIAGVAGIDLMLLVIAADEGVMPQTKEHLDILGYLGIQHGIIVISKIDRVEDDWLELVVADIRSALKDTAFKTVDMVFVDSKSGKGIEKLKLTIKQTLKTLPSREASGEFRMPIDHVFHATGHGTIVRGTVYEGKVQIDDEVLLLPADIPVKVRQVQVHKEKSKAAIAGQRTAINITGVKRKEVKRGDVLVRGTGFPLTKTIDVFLRTGKTMDFSVKQRSLIKFYTGTSEVNGKLVMFDRNHLQSGEEILCQIQLDEPIVVKRDDRFVIRRPTPAVTIGGGRVLDPFGKKYKYGSETIEKLQQKKSGLPEDIVMSTLDEHKMLSLYELSQVTSISADELTDITKQRLEDSQIVEVAPSIFTTKQTIVKAQTELVHLLEAFHEKYPMRLGMNKAECIQSMQHLATSQLLDFMLEEDNNFGIDLRAHKYIALTEFNPHVPGQWSERIERAKEQLQRDGLGVGNWSDYLRQEEIPETMDIELTNFMVEKKWIYPLDDVRFLHHDIFSKSVESLQHFTDGKPFSLQEAREALQVSRKSLILFLELLDRLKITARTDDQRVWL